MIVVRLFVEEESFLGFLVAESDSESLVVGYVNN